MSFPTLWNITSYQISYPPLHEENTFGTKTWNPTVVSGRGMNPSFLLDFIYSDPGIANGTDPTFTTEYRIVRETADAVSNASSKIIEPIVLDNPASWIPLRGSGEAMPGAGNSFLFNWFSNSQQSFSTLNPATNYTSGAPFQLGSISNIRRYCNPVIWLRDVNQSGTINVIYKNFTDTFTTGQYGNYHIAQSFTVTASANQLEILRLTAPISLSSTHQPFMDVAIQCIFPNPNWCKKGIVFDEMQIYNASLVVPNALPDGYTFIPNTGLQDNNVWALVQNGQYNAIPARSSHHEWDRYMWSITANVPNYVGNADLGGTAYNQVHWALGKTVQPVPPTNQSNSVGTVGVTYFRDQQRLGDNKIYQNCLDPSDGNNVLTSTVFPQMQGTQGYGGGLGLTIAAASGGNSWGKSGLFIGGMVADQLITFASANGIIAGQPNGSLASLKLYLGHFPHYTQVPDNLSSDVWSISGFVIDTTIDGSLPYSHIDDASFPTDGTRSVYNISSSFPNTEDSLYKGYYLYVFGENNNTSGGKSVSIQTFFDPTPTPYLYSARGKWSTDGTYDPNYFVPGGIFNPTTNTFGSPPDHPNYKRFDFGATTSITFDRGSMSSQTSGIGYPEIQHMWRCQPNTTNAPQLLNVTTTSTTDKWDIHGITTSNGIYGFNSLSNLHNINPSGGAAIVLPNEYVYGYANYIGPHNETTSGNAIFSVIDDNTQHLTLNTPLTITNSSIINHLNYNEMFFVDCVGLSAGKHYKLEIYAPQVATKLEAITTYNPDTYPLILDANDKLYQTEGVCSFQSTVELTSGNHTTITPNSQSMVCLDSNKLYAARGPYWVPINIPGSYPDMLVRYASGGNATISDVFVRYSKNNIIGSNVCPRFIMDLGIATSSKVKALIRRAYWADRRGETNFSGVPTGFKVAISDYD